MNLVVIGSSGIWQGIKRSKSWLLSLGFLGITIGVSLIPDITIPGRLSLLIFSITVSLWTLTRLNVSYVAVFAALALVLTGVTPQSQMFQTLGDEIIWLMIRVVGK